LITGGPDGLCGLMVDAAVSDHFHVLVALEGEWIFFRAVNPGPWI